MKIGDGVRAIAAASLIWTASFGAASAQTDPSPPDDSLETETQVEVEEPGVVGRLLRALDETLADVDREELTAEAQRAWDEAREALGPTLSALQDALGDLQMYHPPEVLPNGDILIRRRQNPADASSETDPSAEGAENGE